MFASGRYSVAHYLIHAMPPVSANAYMHFERNFRQGHVQLYCLTQWILTRAGHSKITSIGLGWISRIRQGHTVRQSILSTMLKLIGFPSLPSAPPPPLAFYIFKAPNGVRFQRPIFLQPNGSSAPVVDSSAPG